MKAIEPKVTNEECAKQLNVGKPTVIAVKKMLGISGARSVFVSAISKFLNKYQDFKLADAENMKAFKKRHPKFQIPNAA